MFDRLGGYRQRYAPLGAGSEDAEFWTRAGAYGFKAKKVTSKPLFIYSWMSGRVSGNPDYKEVDWLDWHPWVKDYRHPFFSLATPRARSHPARQYDEPVVSVIIPVGPGHFEYLVDALDSLEAQTFRQWEVIVVNDTAKDVPTYLRKAYPYVIWWHTKKRGAGRARNIGVKKARAPFLLFLDADDYLTPDCLELMLAAWKDEEAIIYTDYVGRAFIEDFSKLAPDLRGKVYQTNERTNESFIGYRSADYDVARAQRQPEFKLDAEGRMIVKPYDWCIMTTLIPKEWHDEIGGFDESMVTWEDIDYHWRMAKAGKCYIRIPEELVVYRFYSGIRRQAGYENWQSVVEYLKSKYEEIETVVCGCRGGNSRVTRQTVRAPFGVSAQIEMEHNDEDYVMVKYLHPNRGNHHVIGAETKTKYGYRSGGSQFLVNMKDIKAQPHLFEIIGSEAKVPEPEAGRVTAPPQRLA
jgi:GT2 family glycosyltransferase